MHCEADLRRDSGRARRSLDIEADITYMEKEDNVGKDNEESQSPTRCGTYFTKCVMTSCTKQKQLIVMQK